MAKVGPFEVELGNLAESREKGMSGFSQLNQAMAVTRLLELENTEGRFGAFFTDEQRTRMQKQMELLKKLTADG